jgi:sulfite reductase (ferredoxin)
VGGGLSTEPHLAVRLIPAFIPQDKAYDVVKAVCEIFREQEALRENRTRARIKYLFMKHGWTAESMLAAIEEKLGYKFDPSPTKAPSPTTSIAITSVYIVSRQEGLSGCGCKRSEWASLAGPAARSARPSARPMAMAICAPRLARTLCWSTSRMRRRAELVKEIDRAWPAGCADGLLSRRVACTGTEFCKLAISETKGFAKWLVGEMEERLPEFDQQMQAARNGLHQLLRTELDRRSSALRARRSRRTASWSMPSTSAWAVRWASMRGPARQIGYRAAAESTKADSLRE